MIIFFNIYIYILWLLKRQAYQNTMFIFYVQLKDKKKL
jgi:hypothetical protein